MFLEKCLISGLRQEKFKMILVPESKEMLLKKKMMGPCKRDTKVNLKELPLAKSGTI